MFGLALFVGAVFVVDGEDGDGVVGHVVEGGDLGGVKGGFGVVSGLEEREDVGGELDLVFCPGLGKGEACVGEAFAEEGDGLEEVAGLVVGDDGYGGADEPGCLVGDEFGMEGCARGVAREGEGGELRFEGGGFDEWEPGGEESLARAGGDPVLDLAYEAVVGVGFSGCEDFGELDDEPEA